MFQIAIDILDIGHNNYASAFNYAMNATYQ